MAKSPLYFLIFILWSLNVQAADEDWVYTTRPGDTLWDISKTYLVGVEYWPKVQKYNAIKNPKLLPPGSRLLIPVSWLKQQPSHHYTLQLAASIDKSLLESHYTNLPLEQQHAIVESVRNGKTWYALVYGSFANVRDARLAFNALPSNMTAWQPWIRSFGDIKSWRVQAGLEKE